MSTAAQTMILSLLVWLPAWTGAHAAQGEIEVGIRPGILERAERERPAEVFVYEIVAGDSRVWMERMSRVLGMQGRSKDGRELLTLTDGDSYLEVRKISNAAFYGELDRLWKAEPTPERTQFKVPNDAQSKEIALGWLGKLGFTDRELKTVDVSVVDELFELTTPENKDRPKKVVVGKNVEIRRRVDGIPVYGPGSKIKLYVEEDGKVSGITAVWRQVDPGSKVLGHKTSRGERKGRALKLMRAKDAFEALRKEPLNRLPMLNVHRIMVDQVELAYYGRSAVEPQKFLQPVYVFRGTAYTRMADGKEIGVPYEQYVVGLVQPLESIWPVGKEHKAPARRDTKRRTPRDVDEKGE